MRANIYKELYWTLATIALTVTVGLWMFDGRFFQPATIDIQLHDSYFVFPKFYILTTFFLGILTSVYLIRGIYYKLNNRIINGTLTLLLVTFVVGLLVILNMIKELEIRMLDMSFWDHSHYSWTEPHLTTWIQKRQADVVSKFKVANGILWALLIVTGTTMMITGYKTFRKRAA